MKARVLSVVITVLLFGQLVAASPMPVRAEPTDIESTIDGFASIIDPGNEADLIPAIIDWEVDILELGLNDADKDTAGNVGEKFLRILSGQFEYGELVGYVAAMVTIVSALMGLSQVMYPGQYDPLTKTISSLGNREKNTGNPEIFSTAMIIQVIMYLPLVFNLYEKMAVIDESLSLVAAICCLVGCVGLVLLAIFDESFGGVHDFVAVMAFGGFIIGIVIWGVMFTMDADGANIYGASSESLDVLYGFCIFTVAGLAISQLLRVVLDLDRDNPTFPECLVNWPLWEWICWYTLQVAIPFVALEVNK